MTRKQLEQLALAYDVAPVTSGYAHAAYRRLAEYTLARFADAVHDGWRFIAGDYSEAPDMRLAVNERRLPVHDKDHDHPELSDRENWCFRAIHDVYGHAAVGADFTMDGEIKAAYAQLNDFQAYAGARRKRARCGIEPWTAAQLADTRAAIWAEIVGQAAYFAVHGGFPQQKAVISLGAPWA